MTSIRPDIWEQEGIVDVGDASYEKFLERLGRSTNYERGLGSGAARSIYTTGEALAPVAQKVVSPVMRMLMPGAAPALRQFEQADIEGAARRGREEAREFYDPAMAMGRAGEATGYIGGEMAQAMALANPAARAMQALPAVGVPIGNALTSSSRLRRAGGTMAANLPIDVMQGAKYDEGMVLPGTAGSIIENSLFSGLAGALGGPTPRGNIFGTQPNLGARRPQPGGRTVINTQLAPQPQPAGFWQGGTARARRRGGMPAQPAVNEEVGLGLPSTPIRRALESGRRKLPAGAEMGDVGAIGGTAGPLRRVGAPPKRDFVAEYAGLTEQELADAAVLKRQQADRAQRNLTTARRRGTVTQEDFDTTERLVAEADGADEALAARRAGVQPQPPTRPTGPRPTPPTEAPVRPSAAPSAGVRGVGAPEGTSRLKLSPEQLASRGVRETEPLNAFVDGPLYRETSVDGAMQMLPEGGIITDLTPERPFFANAAEYALGQGKNKGVLLEFDPAGIKGGVSKAKPMWQASWERGYAEFEGRFNNQRDYQSAVRAFTIKPDAVAGAVEKRRMRFVIADLKKRGWVEQRLPDGSMRYSRPDVAVATEAAPSAAPTAARAPKAPKKGGGKAAPDDTGLRDMSKMTPREQAEYTKRTTGQSDANAQYWDLPTEQIQGIINRLRTEANLADEAAKAPPRELDAAGAANLSSVPIARRQQADALERHLALRGVAPTASPTPTATGKRFGEPIIEPVTFGAGDNAIEVQVKTGLSPESYFDIYKKQGSIVSFELRGPGLGSPTGFRSVAGVTVAGELDPQKLTEMAAQLAEQYSKKATAQKPAKAPRAAKAAKVAGALDTRRAVAARDVAPGFEEHARERLGGLIGSHDVIASTLESRPTHLGRLSVADLADDSFDVPASMRNKDVYFEYDDSGYSAFLSPKDAADRYRNIERFNSEQAPAPKTAKAKKAPAPAAEPMAQPTDYIEKMSQLTDDNLRAIVEAYEKRAIDGNLTAAQLKAAGIPQMKAELARRGAEIGLPFDEAMATARRAYGAGKADWYGTEVGRALDSTGRVLPPITTAPDLSGITTVEQASDLHGLLEGYNLTRLRQYLKMNGKLKRGGIFQSQIQEFNKLPENAVSTKALEDIEKLFDSLDDARLVDEFRQANARFSEDELYNRYKTTVEEQFRTGRRSQEVLDQEIRMLEKAFPNVQERYYQYLVDNDLQGAPLEMYGPARAARKAAGDEAALERGAIESEGMVESPYLTMPLEELKAKLPRRVLGGRNIERLSDDELRMFSTYYSRLYGDQMQKAGVFASPEESVAFVSLGGRKVGRGSAKKLTGAKEEARYAARFTEEQLNWLSERGIDPRDVRAMEDAAATADQALEMSNRFDVEAERRKLDLVDAADTSFDFGLNVQPPAAGGGGGGRRGGGGGTGAGGGRKGRGGKGGNRPGFADIQATSTLGGYALGTLAGALLPGTKEEKAERALGFGIAGAGLGAGISTALVRRAAGRPQGIRGSTPSTQQVNSTIRIGARNNATQSWLTRWEKFLTEAVSENLPLTKAAEEAMPGAGRIMDEEIARAQGSALASKQYMLDTIGQPLRAAVGKWDDVRALLVARRNLDLRLKGVASKNPTTTATLRQAVLDAERDPAVKAAADAVNRVYRDLLRMKWRAGLLTDEAFNAIRDSEDFYSPFVREFATPEAAARVSGKKWTVSGSGVNRMDRELEVLMDTADPLEVVVQSIRRTFDAIGRQNVQNVITTFADLGLTPNLVEVIPGATPKGSNTFVALRNGVPVTYRVLDEDLFKALSGQGPMSQGLIMRIGQFFKNLLTTTVTSTPGFAVLNMMRDMPASAIQRPDFSRAISEAGIGAGIGGALGMAQDEEDALRGFLLGAGAGATGGLYARPFFNQMAAIKNIVNNDAVYREWLRRGGSTAGFNVRTPDDARKVLRELERNGITPKDIITPRSWWQAITYIGTVAEQSTRLAAYKEMLDYGATVPAAILNAQDRTLRFSNVGRETKGVASLTPFWNAKVQGWNKLGRLLTNPKTAALGVAMITAPTIALWSVNKDIPEYWDRPLWERNLFWLIPKERTKDGKQEFWRIPKPFELGYIFASVPERLLDYAAQSGVDIPLMGELESVAPETAEPGRALGRTIKQFAGSTVGEAALPIPAAIAPAIQMGMNYDMFRDRPIVSQPNLPAAQQVVPESSALSRVLADKMAIPPQMVDFAVRGYTGTIGSAALDAQNALVRAMGGEAPQPRGRKDGTLADRAMAFVMPRLQTQEYSTTETESAARDRMARLEVIFNGLNAEAKSRDMERARRYRDENRADLIAYGNLRGELATLDKITAERRRITRDRRLTDFQKEERLGVLKNRADIVSRRILAYEARR